MRVIHRTSQFKKDVKRMNKRGKSFSMFKEVVGKLASDEPLPEKYQDHQLAGNYQGTRECHIEPDWLLIYELAENELVLVRTGSHSDLFR
jgi:mRNA interferase YafQ